MQGGLTTADRIVAVSPGYAEEIQTPEGGWGLEGMINSRHYILNGVLNGDISYSNYKRTIWRTVQLLTCTSAMS